MTWLMASYREDILGYSIRRFLLYVRYFDFLLQNESTIERRPRPESEAAFAVASQDFSTSSLGFLSGQMIGPQCMLLYTHVAVMKGGTFNAYLDCIWIYDFIILSPHSPLNLVETTNHML